MNSRWRRGWTPRAGLFQMVTNAVRAKPKRVVFAEGEEDSVIRAAAAFQNGGMGKAILVGRVDVVKAGLRRAGIDEHLLEIRVPHSAQEAAPFIDALYKRIQRRGGLHRDAVRMVTNDRNVYAASMLKAGEADAMVTGVTRNYANVLADVRTGAGPAAGPAPHRHPGDLLQGPRRAGGRYLASPKCPPAEQLADIAMQAAATARRFGLTPRVALLASSTFGFPRSERSERIIEAVQILEHRGVDFEYDGEMAIDVALDKDKLALYPVRPHHRHRQCADHAGDPFRFDLHQAAATDGRRQRHGSDAGGPGEIGADRAPGRQDERNLQCRGDRGL